MVGAPQRDDELACIVRLKRGEMEAPDRSRLYELRPLPLPVLDCSRLVQHELQVQGGNPDKKLRQSAARKSSQTFCIENSSIPLKATQLPTANCQLPSTSGIPGAHRSMKRAGSQGMDRCPPSAPLTRRRTKP